MILIGFAAFAGVLEDPDFRFCHNNRDYDYNEQFCGLVDAIPDGTCEGFKAFCKAPEEAPTAGCNGDSFGGGFGPLGRGASDNVKRPPKDVPGMERLQGCDSPGCGSGCDAPSDGGGCGDASGGASLLPWIVAMVVVFLIAGLFMLIAGYLGFRRETPTRSFQRIEIDDDEVQDFADVVDDVPDLPARDLLTAAKDAHARGDLGEAAILARGAVLRELGEQGLVRLHRARSDREYVRQVEVPQRGDMGDVMDAAAAYRWGRIPLTSSSVQRALDAAARLLTLSALLLLCVPAWGYDRFGPAGDVALFRLLEAEGYEVEFHKGLLEDVDEGVGVLVLDRAALQPNEDDWDALLSWVEGGHVLVVAGESPWFGSLLSRPVGDDVAGGGWSGAIPVFAHEPLGIDWGTPLIGSSPAVVSAGYEGNGLIIGITDPTLAWNGSMMAPQNEQFWVDLMSYAEVSEGAVVRLATSGASQDDPTPLSGLANLNLLPFAFQVLVLWCAVAWWKGRRFQAPMKEGHGERTFDQHIEAVAGHYARLRADDHAVSSLATYLLAEHGPEGLALLAIRDGLTRSEATETVAKIRNLADEPGSVPDPKLLETMCKWMTTT